MLGSVGMSILLSFLFLLSLLFDFGGFFLPVLCSQTRPRPPPSPYQRKAASSGAGRLGDQLWRAAGGASPLISTLSRRPCQTARACARGRVAACLQVNKPQTV